MCRPSKDIIDFGKVVIKRIVNNESFEKEINRFEKKGYKIYRDKISKKICDSANVKKNAKIEIEKKEYFVCYDKLSKKQYSSPNFEKYAKKKYKKLVENSKGKFFAGTLILYPFITNDEGKKEFELLGRNSFLLKSCSRLCNLSKICHDRRCLTMALVNPSNKPSKDTNLYLMEFYVA